MSILVLENNENLYRRQISLVFGLVENLVVKRGFFFSYCLISIQRKSPIDSKAFNGCLLTVTFFAIGIYGCYKMFEN